MPLPCMQDRRTSSPCKLQNLSSGNNNLGECIKMNALYLVKSAIFNEVVLEVD